MNKPLWYNDPLGLIGTFYSAGAIFGAGIGKAYGGQIGTALGGLIGSIVGLGPEDVPADCGGAAIGQSIGTHYGEKILGNLGGGRGSAIDDFMDGPGDGNPTPPTPPYNAFAPNTGMPYQAGPDGAPAPGTPGSPQEPTPNNYDSTGRYIPAPPGAPPDQ